jgi:hypothetical protein
MWQKNNNKYHIKVTINKEFAVLPPPAPSRKDSGQALPEGDTH